MDHLFGQRSWLKIKNNRGRTGQHRSARSSKALRGVCIGFEHDILTIDKENNYFYVYGYTTEKQL